MISNEERGTKLEYELKNMEWDKFGKISHINLMEIKFEKQKNNE